MAIQPEGLVCAHCLVELQPAPPTTPPKNSSCPHPARQPAASAAVATASTHATASTQVTSQATSQAIAQDASTPKFATSSALPATAEALPSPSQPAAGSIAAVSPLLPSDQKIFRVDSAHAEPKRPANAPANSADSQPPRIATQPTRSNSDSSSAAATATAKTRSNNPQVSLADLETARTLMSTPVSSAANSRTNIAIACCFALGQLIVISASIQGLVGWGVVGGILSTIAFVWRSRVSSTGQADANDVSRSIRPLAVPAPHATRPVIEKRTAAREKARRQLV